MALTNQLLANLEDSEVFKRLVDPREHQEDQGHEGAVAEQAHVEEVEGGNRVRDLREAGEHQSQAAKAEHRRQAEDWDVGGDRARLVFKRLRMECYVINILINFRKCVLSYLFLIIYSYAF